MVWNPGQALFGGRYIIARKLGEGGIGVTYLVSNERDELRVVKTLRAELLDHPVWKPHQTKLKQDFRDEAVRLAVCRHPHIVQVENIFDEGNLPCMVMEYIAGEDLGQRLQRLGVLSEAEALLYIHQIGEALKVIHSKGLLHRDLKPRNIMIRSGKSEAVLIDFGIAREFIPNAVQRHTVYRTPGFAPPEQYEFEAPRGEYIDVYALAATLYNLLTGVVPTNAVDRRHNIPLEQPRHFNTNISHRVNQAILQGMELRPHLRPKSVQAWLDLLSDGQNKPLNQILVSKSQTPTLVIGSLRRWQCIHTLTEHRGMVHTVTVSPDGCVIASGGQDSTIKLWQLGNGKLLRTLGRWFSGHASAVRTVAFSPYGEILASGSWDDTIKLWQVSTGKEMCSLTGHTNWVNSVIFSPDRQFLASGSADCTVKLWLLSTGEETCTFIGHLEPVCAVVFSPDGKMLASGSADCTIKLWQVITGQAIRTFSGHSFYVNSVVFHPDGETFASGSADCTIKLWQVNTGQQIRTLSGHNNSVCSVSFSPDGQYLVSGSWDTTIKVWQVSSGEEVSTLAGHSDYVRAVAFSPDGQTIISASDDSTVKIWQQKS